MNLDNKKQIATIALAVGLGLVAAFLMGQYINGEVQTQTKILAQGYEKKSAAVIQELENVRGQMEAMKREQASLAKRVSEQKVIVQQAAAPQGQQPAPVTATAFSLQTPPGKRAYTVRISSLSAVGGLIVAGDFVDIIADLNVPKDESDKNSQEVTTILFQKIQILAVGTDYEFSGQASQYVSQQRAAELNVTLALDAEQASLLAFAQKHGKFQMILRSPTEKESKVLQVASWEALADYVMEHQGTELVVPEKQAEIKEVGKTEKTDKEVKPLIQIFKSGQESNF